MTGRRSWSAQDLAALNARRDRALSSIKISSIIGLAVKLVKSGSELTGLCPFHADRNVGSFMVNDAKGLFKCFSCGEAGNSIDFLVKYQRLDFMEALETLENSAGLSALDFNNPELLAKIERQREQREAEAAKDAESRRSRAASLWRGAVPIGSNGKATPALAYLIGRGLDFPRLGRLPGALRYRPDIGHPDFKGQKNNRHPAMIAAIFGLSGQVIGCHRTYLDISGWDHAKRAGTVTKMDGVSDAKLTLGPSLGGHIPIWKGQHRHPLRDIPAGTDIYLSEGIEDAASVAVADPRRRVICGVSLSKLGGIELPAQMGRLVLIGQNDDMGSAAADAIERAIAAHQERGRRVAMMMPPPNYKDFNDLLMGRAMTRADGGPHGG